ncbi:PDGLE domain-containing protein [Nocardioides sp. GXQ0305]|uniref:PDGLE domain-containing protein n=1 Tax=Nocardioides sp. GXQ0305 TaxID=3423912 RepID=UPI003D7DC4CE
MRTRTFLLGGLLVALLLAGVASYYASAQPDGLEYVADRTGFLDTADDHATGDGPMADYSVTGIDSPRLAGGLAGVVGVLVTLLVAGGIGYAVRRRRAGPELEAESQGSEAR